MKSYTIVLFAQPIGTSMFSFQITPLIDSRRPGNRHYLLRIKLLPPNVMIKYGAQTFTTFGINFSVFDGFFFFLHYKEHGYYNDVLYSSPKEVGRVEHEKQRNNNRNSGGRPWKRSEAEYCYFSRISLFIFILLRPDRDGIVRLILR